MTLPRPISAHESESGQLLAQDHPQYVAEHFDRNCHDHHHPKQAPDPANMIAVASMTRLILARIPRHPVRSRHRRVMHPGHISRKLVDLFRTPTLYPSEACGKGIGNRDRPLGVDYDGPRCLTRSRYSSVVRSLFA